MIAAQSSAPSRPNQEPPPLALNFAPVDAIEARRVQEGWGVDKQGPRRDDRLLNMGPLAHRQVGAHF